MMSNRDMELLDADLIQDTYRSMEALYERFDVSISPDTTARMLAEEVRELLQAADIRATYDRLTNEANTDVDYEWLFDKEQAKRTDVALEAADVFFTLMGVLRAAGIGTVPFKVALDKINQRNDAKTLDTHFVVAGKITRKVATDV